MSLFVREKSVFISLIASAILFNYIPLTLSESYAGSNNFNYKDDAFANNPDHYFDYQNDYSAYNPGQGSFNFHNGPSASGLYGGIESIPQASVQNFHQSQQTFSTQNGQYHQVDEAVPISETIEVTKSVPIPIIRHIGIPIHQQVPVNVPQPVAIPVPVPQPVHVHVPQPVAIPVIRTIAVPIEKPVPYAVEKHVPYPVIKHVPVTVEKHIPVPVPKPYPVRVPVIKTIYHHKTRGWDDRRW